jgi:serine/threonine-protein phosphatase Stp1
MQLDVYTATHQGKRDYQEDRFLANIEDQVFAIADGMGGHPNGHLAAQQAIDSLGKLASDTKQQDHISQALRAAHNANEQAGDGRCTVVTGVVFDGTEVTIFNVGDSRTYLMSSEDNELHQITEDHQGIYGGITNCLGFDYSGADLFLLQAQPEDIFVLASDGVFGAVNKNQLAKVLLAAFESGLNPAEALVDFGVKSMGKHADNATAIVIKVS